MLLGISNEPRQYHWGSRTAIAELLGREPSAGPEAELWLGAHPGSPSRILEPSAAGGAADLAEFTAPDGLPFLLKILAAERPLSLQVHPNAEHARDGYEAENTAGIALADPRRNYKDPLHKPELIIALSDEFRALVGFRAIEDTRALLIALLSLGAGRPDAPEPAVLAPLVARVTGPDPLATTVRWLLAGGEDVAALVSAVVALAALSAEDAPHAAQFRLLGELAELYPDDPGIVISLLLNHVVLHAGEALYLAAGNIHSYLSGVGVELMASSDNVLRGGLTSKHVDATELMSVLDATPTAVPLLPAVVLDPGVSVFRPPLPDFQLYRIDLDPDSSPEASVPLTGPAIAIVTTGVIDVLGKDLPMLLRRGQALFATGDETSLSFRGEGTVFLATVGVAGAATS